MKKIVFFCTNSTSRNFMFYKLNQEKTTKMIFWIFAYLAYRVLFFAKIDTPDQIIKSPPRIRTPPLLSDFARSAKNFFPHKTPVIPKKNKPPPLIKGKFFGEGGGLLNDPVYIEQVILPMIFLSENFGSELFDSYLIL